MPATNVKVYIGDGVYAWRDDMGQIWCETKRGLGPAEQIAFEVGTFHALLRFASEAWPIEPLRMRFRQTPQEPPQKLVQIVMLRDPCTGKAQWDFRFADGSVKTTYDPAEVQQWRDLYRVKEGRTYG